MLSRRKMLKWAAVAAIAKDVRAAPLTTDTFAILDAAACRILPSDDGPGAREARVGRFIQRQLEGDLRELRPAFDQLALLLERQGFVTATPEQQDAILERVAHAGGAQEALFRGLHSLTLEGFLSDPVHGGNDREVGWKSIGFRAPGLRHAHH
jgi:gluconate 2-dehydrogenase gamma chain